MLVEDDPRLADVLSDALTRRGWTVDAVHTRGDAYAALRVATYTVMILDLGLPDGDGLALLRSIRAVGDPLPVLILTARGKIAERVEGLNAGADDYMTKPCATVELHARLLALTRRAAGAPSPVLHLGPIEYDQAARLATVHGRPLSLSLRPTMVLEALMQAKGRFVQRTELENALFNFESELESRALDVYIHRLRTVLAAATAEVTVESRRGLGYRLAVGGGPS